MAWYANPSHSLFGRMTSGIASDKIGKFNAFILSCYATGIFTLALWIPGNTNGSIIAFAALFGFTSGAYVSLIAALVAQISPPQEIGFRTGLVFLVCSLPGLTAGPIAGAIIAHTGGWLGLKIFAGIFALAGTTFIVGAKAAHVGFRPTAVF